MPDTGLTEYPLDGKQFRVGDPHPATGRPMTYEWWTGEVYGWQRARNLTRRKQLREMWLAEESRAVKSV